MNKIIISIIGIFVMTGLVYALATFTAAGGGLVGHWALDAESYDSNTERITDKTPYENHGTNYGATLTTDQMGQGNRAMSFDVNEESLILNYMIWKDGQTGSVGSFSRNGDTSENYRVIDRDPWGRQVVVWEARPDNVSGPDGGWNHAAVAIDNTKLYRFSTWVNRKVMGVNGYFYLGTHGYGSVNGVKRLTGDTNYTNPYFWVSASPPGSGLPEDEWILVVGHVHPYNHTGTSNHVDSGRYNISGKVGSISYDYKWLPETTSGNHRSYLYYCTDTSVRQQWIYPRMEVVDGTEPSIEELLGGYGNYGDDIVAEVVEDKESFSFWYVNNSNGNWTHVVNSSGTLYVNGELGTPNQYPLYVSGNNVYIGRTTASDFFNGTISDVRIYNHALSADEIDTLYHSYRPKASTGSLQKGLVGHWALDAESYDSNTERITDKTPYENHGTNNGSILTTDRMGQSNGAMSFDGSGTVDGVTPGDNVVITESITNTDNYPDGCTYSVWLYVDPDAVDRMSLLWGAGTIRHIEIYSTGKYFRTEAAKQNGYSFGTGNFPDDVRGVWSHFVIVFANNETNRPVRWYQNGNLFHTGTMDGGDYPGTEYFSFSRIGRSTGSVSYLYAKSFDGKISDVRIYNHVLNADEIDTLYHSYRPKASSGSLQKGLILDMPLTSKYTKDETVGSEIMTDRTPYSNDGQNYGATVGSSYTDFDGVDDYIDLPNDLGYTTQVSAFAWFKREGDPLGNYHIIFGPSQFEISIPDPGGSLRTGIQTTVNRFVSNHGSGLLDGEWHFIGFTFDGTVKKSYIDGQYVGEQTGITGSLLYSFSARRMGRHGTSGTYYLNGLISDIRIYNHALSPSEIKLLYDKGR